MFKNLRSKFFANFIAIIILAVAFTAIAFSYLNYKQYKTNLVEELHYENKIILEVLKPYNNRLNSNEVQQKVYTMGKDFNKRITVVLPDGNVVADSWQSYKSLPNLANRIEFKQALDGKEGFSLEEDNSFADKSVAVTMPIYNNYNISQTNLTNKDITGVLLLSTDGKNIISYSGKFITLAIIVFFIIAFLAALLSWRLNKKLYAPIRAISEGAEAMAAGNLKTRIPTQRLEEFENLGQTINNMAYQLKQQIEEISQAKSNLENVLKNIPSPVIILDKNSDLIDINSAGEKVFNLKLKDSEGQNLLALLHHSELYEKIQLCLETEEVIEYEGKFNYPYEMTLKMFLAPFYGQKKLRGITIVSHDITALLQANKMKTDFVANASHELRTPLTIIQGNAETLLDGALDDPNFARSFVKAIEREAQHLRELLEELLFLAQLEQEPGKAPKERTKLESDKIEPSKSYIKKAVEQSIELCKNDADDKNIKITYNIPDDLPPVKIRSALLQQVIYNLVDNAIKYIPQDGIIDIKTTKENGIVKVSVKDNGPGLSIEEQNRIFERFYQVDKSRSAPNEKSFGLGLAIVKHIVESAGGQIGVKSKVNNGSDFWFALPKA